MWKARREDAGRSHAGKSWKDIPFVKEVVAKSKAQVIVATGLYWDVPRRFAAAQRPARWSTSRSIRARHN